MRRAEKQRLPVKLSWRLACAQKAMTSMCCHTLLPDNRLCNV